MEISRGPALALRQDQVHAKLRAMYGISNSEWKSYLSGHRHPMNRLLHVLGWTVLLGCLLAAAWFGSWLLVAAGIAGSYALAWLGHFVFERNTPQTFQRPLFSALASLRLFLSIVSGRTPLDAIAGKPRYKSD
jgi:hypothetical protein